MQEILVKETYPAGTLPETLTLFQTKICDFRNPISDLIQNLIPYFRPEALEPGAWLERVTSCYGTYTVVGLNSKRKMVFSPNNEEVANSSKKNTQFKTRVHKHTLFQAKMVEIDTLFQTKTAKKNIPFGAAVAYIRATPHREGAKNALQITSLAAHASETNKYAKAKFSGQSRARWLPNQQKAHLSLAFHR